MRAMLADEVRLDLVNRTRLNGHAQAATIDNYARVSDWHLVPGQVDRPPGGPGVRSQRPGRFAGVLYAAGVAPAILIGTIRDFLFARYIIDGAEFQL